MEFLMGLLDQQSYAGYADEGQRLAVEPMSFTPMDAAKFIAEATPIIGDAMAAKEIYDEIQKPDPNYGLVAALAGASLIGLVPLIGDAAAPPLKKVARGLLDVVDRIEVDPSVMGSTFGNIKLRKPPEKAVKGELDPLGYQKVRMKDAYIDETDVKVKDLKEKLPRVAKSWEDTEGKVILPFYGDRSSGGLLVEGVNDIIYDKPVYTEGGVDFMRGLAAQKDKSIWASNSNIVKRIDDVSKIASEKYDGADILGVTGSMAPDANDFATMTGASMGELIKAAPITKKSAKQVDDIMKSIDPDFVGVLSPNIRDWLETTTSPKRKSFIRLLDSKPFQEMGFPSSGLARYSVTDATQRDMPAGMFGLGAAKVDTTLPLLSNTKRGNLPIASVPHSTYNTQIAGDYFGSLPPVPQKYIFDDIYNAMEGKVDKRGYPLTSANITHAIKTKMPAVMMTPERIEGILNYLSRMEK